MFTNPTMLKKLMKAAYKGAGLRVGNSGDTIYIGGGYWELEIHRDNLPRTILACIIELAGELPKEGDQYNATKDGNQMEILRTVKTPLSIRRLTRTPFLLESGSVIQSMLQDEETGRIFLLNHVFTDMIGNENIDVDNGELEVDGPLYDTFNSGVYWRNNVMTFRAGFRVAPDRMQKVLHRMEPIDLSGIEYEGQGSYSENPNN